MLGVNLSVLAGPTIPLPLPAPFAAKVKSVTVTENDRERSAFTITLDAGRSGPAAALDSPVMMGCPIAVNARVVVILTVGAVPQILMDGIVTEIELVPGEGPGTALMRATGQDVSLFLDRHERDAEHVGLEDSLQVRKILAPYMARGILAQVIPPPTMDPPLPIQRTPTQQATDLTHVSRLAAWHGHVAYMTPGPMPGTSTFYWGPPVRVGLPQPALSVDLGPNSNVTGTPTFRQDVLVPQLVEGSVADPLLGETIPVRTVASLRPPLAAMPAWLVNAGNIRTRRLRETGVAATTAFARAQASTDSSIDCVVGEGELDGGRYGAVLRPRGLVGMRGAGWSHDGLWYVKQVEHTVRRGSYTQRFTITRDGYGSTVPAVRV